MKLEGKVALITGAGSGLGEAIALRFAQEGADIAVNDIDLTSAEKTAVAIKKMGRRALAIKADVTAVAEVNAMVDHVINQLGGVHILVNNAGIGGGGPVLEESLETWDRVLSVHLRGAYLCSRAAGQWMASQKTGTIVNMSSIAGMKGSVNMNAYSSAKGGVISLTRALAMEWAKYNIRVNCIAPGIINTPMTQHTAAVWCTPERIKEMVPLGRIGESEEVANLALFLASSDSSYITAITIPIDGGMLYKGD
jgi:3-oxoacyl-[acyl-carrier protein] reductase